ncbi:MAG: membrane protein insertion efficiency factor YidD [Akkermansia sp.]|nr:membrane protein insertion efficiency factor YidD [Akkermansia sp.]
MKALLKFCIRFYQLILSAPLHILAGPHSGCRFTPSCSQYFMEALEVHGAWKGTLLGVLRVLRCNPWGKCGHDPVPPRKQ